VKVAGLEAEVEDPLLLDDRGEEGEVGDVGEAGEAGNCPAGDAGN
jgi:hypothetical protein